MPTSQSQPTLHTSSRIECTPETSKPVLNLFERQTRTSWWSSLTMAARRLSTNNYLSVAIDALIWESSVLRHLEMSSLITGTISGKASCNMASAILASCPREGLARNGPRDYSRRGGAGLELVRERTRELVRESCSLRLETKGCGYRYELIISTNRRHPTEDGQQRVGIKLAHRRARCSRNTNHGSIAVPSSLILRIVNIA